MKCKECSKPITGKQKKSIYCKVCGSTKARWKRYYNKHFLGGKTGIGLIYYCLDCGSDISNRQHTAYLCKECAKDRCTEYDRKRSIKRWEERNAVALGGTLITEHMRRNENGTPNFSLEKRIIFNEVRRTLYQSKSNRYVPSKPIPLARTEEEEEEDIFMEIETPLSRCEKYILMWCELMYDVITVSDIQEIKLRAITDGFNELEIEQAIDDLEDKLVARRSKFTKEVVTYPELIDFGRIDWDDVLRYNSFST